MNYLKPSPFLDGMRRKCQGALLAGAALILLVPLVSAAEEDVDALFEAGMEALEDYRLRTAIDTFNRILSVDPQLHRARLELALAYYRSYQYDAAEQFAQKVLDDPATPDNVRVTVLAFLAQVRSDAEKATEKHQWQPNVSLGYMYDSNANVGPSSNLVEVAGTEFQLQPGSTKASDHASLWSAGLTHSYQFGNTLDVGEQIASVLWQSQASLYHRDYKDNHALNISVATVSTGPSLVVPKHWRAGIQLIVDHIELGSDALATFMSLRPLVTWQFDRTEFTLDATYTDRSYRDAVDSGREGHYLRAGASLGQYYRQRKVAAQAGISYLDFDADDGQFGYDGYEAFVGASVRAWQRGNAYVRASFRDVKHAATTLIGGLPAGIRDEEELRLLVGWSHRFQEGALGDWELGMDVEYTHNDSSVSVYEYERTQITLNLSRGF